MNLNELTGALRQLRLGGMAAVLETRLRQAQTDAMPPLDLLSTLVHDELTRRSDRLLLRRQKEAAFRDAHRTLDNFDFHFNPKMNRSLIFELATTRFIERREDARCSSAQAVPAKATWLRRSDKPRSSRAIASVTARRISCWRSLPTPPPMGRAKPSWPSWRPCRF